ncbi:hypothetical protein ACWGH2_42105 [Streptomyces sp. NPDC054871]
MTEQDDRTFAWTVDGRVQAGTLARFARDYKEGQQMGLDVSCELWDGTTTHTATIERQADTEGDYLPHVVRCAGQTAGFSLDGRG